MANIQEVFASIQSSKKQQRDIRALYREALEKTSDYKDIVDEFSMLREKKKGIEKKVKAEFSREFDKLEELTESLKAEVEMMSDMVLTQLMKGEIVKVRDTYNNSYDPIVKIAFKKSDDQEG